MRLDTNFDEGVTFLAVAGEIDLTTAGELALAGLAAITAACGTLRINLAGVTFLDSTGLGALVQIRNAAAAKTVLILEHPSPQVRRTLEITALAQAFEIDPTPTASPTRA